MNAPVPPPSAHDTRETLGAIPDRKVTVSLPETIVRQLRARVAMEETTMRALILQALAASGYDVPADEIRDRRRRD